MSQSTVYLAKDPSPLRKQVVENLRSAITEGKFKPGESLVEQELCESTGVSRTLIRESLRQLEAEGLIDIVPNKGPIVATISQEDIKHIYEVRLVLEALASQLFAERASDADRSALLASYEEYHQACVEEDIPHASRAKKTFYQILFDGCGNPLLKTQLSQIFSRTSSLRTSTLATSGRLKQSSKEIGILVNAIENHDGKAAWKANQRHVESAAKIALQHSDAPWQA